MYIISGTIFIVSGFWIFILDRHLNDYGRISTDLFYDFYSMAISMTSILVGLFFYNIEYSNLKKYKKK